MSVSLWQLAVGIILSGGLIWGLYKLGASLVQKGRDEQKADSAQGELQERIDADDTMAKAREDYAKKGGAKGALDRGEF